MKFCFLISEFIFFKEFWWKLAQQAAKEGNQCIFLVDGKIAEYGIKEEFKKQNMEFFSKVDWCVKNYNPEKKDFRGLSWKEFFPDFTRHTQYKFDHKNSVEMVSQLYQFLDFIFETQKPDIVVSGCPSILFEQIARHFADKNNVSWLALAESVLSEGRLDVHDLEYTSSLFKSSFDELKAEEIKKDDLDFSKDYIERFLSHKQLPSYMRDQLNYRSKAKLFLVYLERLKRLNERRKIFFKYIINRNKFKKYDHRSDIVFGSFFRVPWDDFIRQLRMYFQKRFFCSYDLNEKFFLYPLHFQPEYTTSVLATYYTDQATTVNNIAFALPFPYKLYVKEHPSSPGTRENLFYEEIKKLPNVVLIDSRAKIQDLVRRSAGVITLSSTVGMEAAFLGKPVYVLGRVFYMHHPFCRAIKGFDHLKSSIEQDLNQKLDAGGLENINLRFVASYYANTIEGSIISAVSQNDKNDYLKIYKELLEIFKKIKK